MDSTLQEKLVILKLGYIQKLKGLIFEFEQMSVNLDASMLDELYSKVRNSIPLKSFGLSIIKSQFKKSAVAFPVA